MSGRVPLVLVVGVSAGLAAGLLIRHQPTRSAPDQAHVGTDVDGLTDEVRALRGDLQMQRSLLARSLVSPPAPADASTSAPKPAPALERDLAPPTQAERDALASSMAVVEAASQSGTWTAAD